MPRTALQADDSVEAKGSPGAQGENTSKSKRPRDRPNADKNLIEDFQFGAGFKDMQSRASQPVETRPRKQAKLSFGNEGK